MAIVKPFKGLRPPKEIAQQLSCLPYDVMNIEEAKEMAKDNEYSLLHITRSEIDCTDGIDIHSQQVYDKAAANLKKFMRKGYLVQDNEKKFYIYAQTMNGRTQYGIVGVAAVEDYLNNVIKKHELTRPEKEEDRMMHVRINNANIEPVFFTYNAVKEIDEIVYNIVKKQEHEYNFTTDDGIGHHFWVVNDFSTNKKIEELFKTKVPATYVADGHHRTAAAALVGQEKRKNNPTHKGNEDYNYFLAVHFPDNQLEIIDYNRVVKDLNGLSVEQFIEKLNDDFTVEKRGSQKYKPQTFHEISIYVDHNWYQLTAKKRTYDDDDPIAGLDVTILSNCILAKILGIKNLRTDQRIEFVGGIRGLEELEQRVDSGEMKVAFALYPVSLQQLINIADTDNIMPPKTTWFEPKLRSGLVIHKL